MKNISRLPCGPGQRHSARPLSIRGGSGRIRRGSPGDQSPTLPAAGVKVITYEYPLNERIRTLLRLEDLFERANHFVAEEDSRAHHAALITLFEILEVAVAQSSSRTCCRSSSDRNRSCSGFATTLKSRRACSSRSF